MDEIENYWRKGLLIFATGIPVGIMAFSRFLPKSPVLAQRNLLNKEFVILASQALGLATAINVGLGIFGYSVYRLTPEKYYKRKDSRFVDNSDEVERYLNDQ